MGRVAVDPVGAARRDHLDRRHRSRALVALGVYVGVAHLHGAGVGAQEQLLAGAVFRIDVEGVLHRARRVVLGAAQGGKVVPVGLDLRAVGDIEADRAKYFLDPALATHQRMQSAARAGAPRQAHIEGLGGQARSHLRLGELFAPRREGRLDLALGQVDRFALRAALVGRQLGQGLEQFGDRAGFAQKARLGFFEMRAVGDAGKLFARLGDD